MKTISQSLLSILLFPSVLFYYELIFREATVHGTWSLTFYPTLLFCLVYGGLCHLICSFIKNKKIHYIIHLMFMLISALPFLVEFFVYRQFKVFYDINTVTGGAGDVAGGFMDDVVRLVTSFDGLFHIFLFLLPTILFVILGKKLDLFNLTQKRALYSIFGMMFLAGSINMMLINTITIFNNAYNKQYNFQAAVTSFGLLTGIRLDITNNLFGNDGGFEIAETILEETETQSSESLEIETQETEIVYEDNIMDIDFEVLEADSYGVYAELDAYVASQRPSSQNEYTGLFKGKNLIMITAEAFSAEVIDPERTPTLYRMATKGINFTDYYQPASAGTIGGEYSNIFGMLPSNGGMSFQNMAYNYNPFTMGAQLNKLGYYGIAYHNNDYTYYSRYITHNSLGYSEGFYGVGNGLEDVISPFWPESDLELMEGTIDNYINNQPFNVYYMTVSGHSEYTDGSNDMSIKNQEAVADMEASDRIRNYHAANLELEYAMEYLIGRLEETGIADDTVIVIAADHFPYGLDYDAALGYMPYLAELYGYEVTNYLQRDHNRLIIWSRCLEDAEPIIVDEPTSSLDILPTLSNLFGLEWDSRLMVGRDVFSDADPLVFSIWYDWKTDKGTYISATGTFTPASEDIEVPSGYVDRINSIVNNRITYCDRVLNYDYFSYLFE